MKIFNLYGTNVSSDFIEKFVFDKYAELRVIEYIICSLYSVTPESIRQRHPNGKLIRDEIVSVPRYFSVGISRLAQYAKPVNKRISLVQIGNYFGCIHATVLHHERNIIETWSKHPDHYKNVKYLLQIIVEDRVHEKILTAIGSQKVPKLPETFQGYMPNKIIQWNPALFMESNDGIGVGYIPVFLNEDVLKKHYGEVEIIKHDLNVR